MDDLTGVQWAPPKPTTGPNHAQPQGNYYLTLRSTPPVSGRSTPSTVSNGYLSKPLETTHSGNKQPGNDSFANLVSFKGRQQDQRLSLQEQQRLLREKKQKDEEERSRQFDSHFGKAFGSTLSTNASGNSAPSRVASPLSPIQPIPLPIPPAVKDETFTAISGSSKVPIQKSEEEESVILAAFKSSAPVDTSTHMPPWTDQKSGFTGNVVGLEIGTKTFSAQPTTATATTEDDDPFGLGPGAPPPHKASPAQMTAMDDDVLGDLGRPISEFPKPRPETEAAEASVVEPPSRPEDCAMAELVDMGFPPEKARRALESTESGTDVHAAVGWLLNQAHQDSGKDKQQPKSSRRNSLNSANSRRATGRRNSSGGSSSKPAWMRDQRRPSATHRHDNKSPTKEDQDPKQLAQQLGNNLFKTANSLWKTGQKKLNQAVAEFNTDADPNHPKWMRETNGTASAQKPAPNQRASNAYDHDRMGRTALKPTQGMVPQPSVTDEALLLESGGARPQRKQNSRPNVETPNTLPVPRGEAMSLPPKEVSPIRSGPLRQSQRDPRAKLTRQAVEEAATQAYISPARRRKVAPKSSPPAAAEPDLLYGDKQLPSGPTATTQPPRINQPSRPRPTPSPARPSRPPPPTRNVPSVSPNALSQSTTHRLAGNAAFKRGDYASATASYTTALSALPPNHPLTLPLLTNRALSHSKTGEAKLSITDGQQALSLIGPSRGLGEVISLDGEGDQRMDLYWAKAQQRLAEAYEQLEKWTDAAAAWRMCLVAGVNTPTAIAGRNRCEAALRPKQPAATLKKPTAQSRPKASALNDLNPSAGQSAEAVSRLRAANAQADKLDDEKFALADAVDAKVKQWRNGKEGNLRALLSSLETVLWPEAGWKKVGMGEVIQPGKVKVVYMRGIGKVHPDKLPTTATTEQKMISAAVFATLNEAWEKFKAENGL